MCNKIEELEDKLNTAKGIESSIWSCNNNIKSYNEVFSGTEIAIKCNADCEHHGDKTIYLSGEIKDAILKLLVDNSTKRVDEYKLKLSEL